MPALRDEGRCGCCGSSLFTVVANFGVIGGIAIRASLVLAVVIIVPCLIAATSFADALLLSVRSREQDSVSLPRMHYRFSLQTAGNALLELSGRSLILHLLSSCGIHISQGCGERLEVGPSQGGTAPAGEVRRVVQDTKCLVAGDPVLAETAVVAFVMDASLEAE